jgi:splicing factor U2AF subunit
MGDRGEDKKRKRRGMWDVDASGNAVQPSPAPSLQSNMNSMMQMQQQAMMNAVLQQQAALTRRARRLHVGNLPPGLSQDALKELFNTTMPVRRVRARGRGACL